MAVMSAFKNPFFRGSIGTNELVCLDFNFHMVVALEVTTRKIKIRSRCSTFLMTTNTAEDHRLDKIRNIWTAKIEAGYNHISSKLVYKVIK
jgi:hypothetical protein